ncbi:hypothetical protein B0F90DRAFT_1623288 [Multifurca ochricompacta]|uniref:Pre-rRNA-processing protein n=1 Tax=Multifurca ochricompacta TaxID=376703 RepID=A0AAD4QRY2_9AGAM|nr:hypothetical protein B0F90DRAFT_1623288 [Multifurca ochricompacta]
MPKAAKKKKEKAADFSKAKLRLGKGKKPSTNQVNTSFKARSIALPAQSITVEIDPNVPTTKRKLTFTDLAAHLRHHNSNIKKDALLGLRELSEAHLEVVEASLALLIGACTRLIANEDASVRRALLSFFTWLLPRISVTNLAPHSATLLLFTASAQTHIFPEIQIDAVRFLDLYLEIFPDAVVCGWRDGTSGHGKRILEGYLSILGAGTKMGEGEDTNLALPTSTASVSLSTSSKLLVFKSISKFLRAALGISANSDKGLRSTSSNLTLCFSSAFSAPAAYQTFDALFRPTTYLQPSTQPPTRRWKARVGPGDDAEHFAFNYKSIEFERAYSLQDLDDATLSAISSDLHKGSQLAYRQSDFEMRLAQALHPVLLSNLLDSAPSVFVPGSTPPQTELGIISAVACIYRNLYGALLQGTEANSNKQFLLDSLQIILERMASYFPFLPNPLNRRDAQIEQAFQDLNIIFCELTSLLLLAYSLLRVAPSNPKKRDGMSIRMQVLQVKGFVARLLRGVSVSSHTMGRNVTAQEYMALLPTLWMLLNSNLAYNGVEEDADILSALLDHALQVSSAAATKRPTVDFLGRLILLETASQYIGTFTVNNNAECLEKFKQWVTHLPKTLWELSDTDPQCTEVILRFLLRLFQRRSPLAQSDASAFLCARLIPYFTITHPTRGALPGPFTKLVDPVLQRLALDTVVVIMARVPAESRGTLDLAVHQAVEGSTWAAYLAGATNNLLFST